MPGYLVSPQYNAESVYMTPVGDISSTNLQDAMSEISSEKATVSSVNTINSNLSNQISSVEGVALLGL